MVTLNDTTGTTTTRQKAFTHSDDDLSETKMIEEPTGIETDGYYKPNKRKAFTALFQDLSPGNMF
jgi:hypothetical protein